MLLIAIGRFVQFALLFITLKVSTTLLSPSEMAKVFLISSIVAFYAMLLLNPVGMFMNRRLHAWNAAGKVRHYYNFFWMYLVVVCFIALASVALSMGQGWIDIHISMAWAVFLVGGSLLFATVNQVVIPGLNLLGYRGWFIGLTVATSATSLVMAVICATQIAPKAEIWICGLFAGQLLIAVVGWKVFFVKANVRECLGRPTKQHISVLAKFAWPISIAVGLNWAQTQSYRFLMESNLGLYALGLFAAGYGISVGLISAFESVFTTYLQPIFYKQVSGADVAEQSKAWSEYAGAIFPSLILIGFIILATASELTHVMLGPEYWPSSQFVIWGVLAELARVASGVYGMVAHARMKTKLLLIPSLVGAAMAMVLILWLMPMFGPNGIGFALASSSIMALLLTHTFTRREVVSILPIKTFFASICMGCVLVLMAELLRNMIDMHEGLTVGILGIFFLVFQYILLPPTLRGRQ